MKCVEIFMGYMNPQVPFEKFVTSKRARSPFGMLFTTLLEETWSKEYEISANFGDERSCDEKPCFEIRHRTFLPGFPLIIYEDEEAVWMVHGGVENAIRDHIKMTKERIRRKIDILQSNVYDLDRASRQIALGKMKAAIVNTFPEAHAATPIMDVVPGDLFFFAADQYKAPTFIAREDYDEVVGVARIYHSFSRHLRGRADGVKKNNMHGLFFAALAKEFAVRELAVKRHELSCKKILAKKKPWGGSLNLYVAKEVVLFQKLSPSQWRLVTVEFKNNLPVSLAPILLAKFAARV